ncbi:HAD family phosphatase [Gemmatimonas aurantiaca]|uniref:HAD family hydrolase n=1 Tax=Gemmatimonas aurantiaca TaxID=173480 RepID=UPI00301CD089
MSGGIGVAEGVPLVARLEGVVFDCDGVLVDSERITNRVWAELLTELGMPTTTEQSLATYLGNSMARCLEIVGERFGRPAPDELLPRFQATVATALVHEVTAVPGIVPLLDRLDAARIPYAVASNGEQTKMQTTLGATGLAARFVDRRFSSLEVGRPKPAPDVYLHAARAIGAAPARTVAVEDSPLGVQAAVAAGMVVIGYAELVDPKRLRAAGAAATVEHLDEVASLLGIPSMVSGS